MARVLVIGDTHAPGMKTGYVRFLQRIANTYDINRVVHIGDWQPSVIDSTLENSQSVGNHLEKK